MNNITYKVISHDSLEYKKAIDLREAVLRIPLGMRYAPNDLIGEEHYIHIAGFVEDEIVASAMLVPEGSKCKMKQVAVSSKLQGKGIGSNLVKFSEEIAIIKGFNQMYCHARDHAVPFYRKNKFTAVGDYFTEINIPHVKMVKSLVV